MKYLKLILLLIITNASIADMIQAQKFYDNNEYKQAFNEFISLAKLGNMKAQYNVAVMYTKGQGTDVDLVKAYAWARINDNIKEYKPLTQIVKSKLTAEELVSAEKYYTEIYPKYAYQNSKVLLGPILTVEEKQEKAASGPQLVVDKSYPPQYPQSMAVAGIQGWVKLMFSIYPDGSVRNIQIVEELPKGAFGNVTIEAIEKFRSHFVKNGKTVKITEPFIAMQRMDFKLQGRPEILNAKQKKVLNDLKASAEKGDVTAQLQYALIQDRYLLKSEIDQATTNQWLFNGAQEGSDEAQFYLGKNIYFGESCKVEKQKGLDWIMHSAQTGNAKAQYLAYQMLKNKTVINPSEQTPFYWLQKSAENGLAIAQLLYAQEISEKDKPTQNELIQAKKYIKDYSKNSFKTTQWYQISALLNDKVGNYSKAYREIKTAYNKAKTHNWDLTQLQQQKAMIKKHKRG